MAKSKKKEKEPKKPSVKIEDLTPSRNPSGGMDKLERPSGEVKVGYTFTRDIK